MTTRKQYRGRVKLVVVCLGISCATLFGASPAFALVCDPNIEEQKSPEKRAEDLRKLEREVEEKKRELLNQEQRVKLAQGEFEAEASKAEASSEKLAAAAEERRLAVFKEGELQKDLAQLEDKLECTERGYANSKRWVHGILPGMSWAGSADEKTMLGLSLRYVHRQNAFFEWSGNMSGHWTNYGTEQNSLNLLMPGGRISFGVRHAWLHFGLAGGILLDNTEMSRSWVVAPEIGLGFRGFHEYNSPLSGLLDFALFMRPVFSSMPGEHTSVLFGIEIQTGLGFGRAPEAQKPPASEQARRSSPRLIL